MPSNERSTPCCRALDEKYVDPKAKPRVPKFSRRDAFADAATHENPLLARAFVAWGALGTPRFFSADGASLIVSGADGQSPRKVGEWPKWGRVQVYRVEV